MKELLMSYEVMYYCYLSLILLLIILKRKDFWNAVVGGDGTFDALDLIKLVWLILFPIIVLSDLFLNLQLSSMGWGTLNAIFFGLIGKDFGSDYIKFKREQKNEKSE